jgi:hypothetical protein
LELEKEVKRPEVGRFKLDAVGKDGETRGLDVDGKHAGLRSDHVFLAFLHRDGYSIII